MITNFVCVPASATSVLNKGTVEKGETETYHKDGVSKVNKACFVEAHQVW